MSSAVACEDRSHEGQLGFGFTSDYANVNRLGLSGANSCQISSNAATRAVTVVEFKHLVGFEPYCSAQATASNRRVHQ